MDKAQELGVKEAMYKNPVVLVMLRKWWIGNKLTPVMIQDAIAYQEAHPLKANMFGIANMYYDLGDYVNATSWFEKDDRGSTNLIRCYINLGQKQKAIEYYYDKLNNKKFSPAAAQEMFPVIWSLILDDTTIDLQAAKDRNARMASKYTSYLYESAKPAESPWRALVTLLTAQSK